MIYDMIATRDIVANLYSIPQFVPSLGAAIRSFGDACKNKSDPNNIIAQHPEDFELVHLGSYNDVEGTFVPMAPKQIAVGANYRD